jgi:starch synthase
VSPTYAREILTPEFGFGFEGILRTRAADLSGILNGIDTATWDPAKDPLLVQNYARTHLDAKQANKAALQAHCGLALDRNAMLFGIVSRLTSQKGIDLVLGLLPRMVEHGAQLVVLGQGERWLHDALSAAAQRFPRSVSVNFAFDEGLAHNIEAGIDCFLMPSRFEPCGLNQMYSQAYGTPPVVSAVGGLKDSVIDADDHPREGTGFVMRSVDAQGMEEAVMRAFAAFRDAGRWRAIQARGMSRPFGWEQSASRYVEVYERALSAARGTAPPSR